MRAIALCAVCAALSTALPASEFEQVANVSGHWVKSTSQQVTPGYGEDDIVGQDQPVWDDQQQEPIQQDDDYPVQQDDQPIWDGNYTRDYHYVRQPQITRMGRPYPAQTIKKAIGQHDVRLAPIVHDYGVPLPALHDQVHEEGFTRDVPVQQQKTEYTHQEVPYDVGETVDVPRTTYTKQPYNYRSYKQVAQTRQVPVTQYHTQRYQTAQHYDVRQYHQVAEEHNVTEVHYKPVVTIHYIPQKEVHYVPVRTQVPVQTQHTVVSQVPQTREVTHLKDVPVKTQQKQTYYHAVPVQHTAYRQVAHTVQVPQQHMVRQYHQERVAHQVPIHAHQVVHYQRQIIDRPHYVDQQEQPQYRQQPQWTDYNATDQYAPDQYDEPDQYDDDVQGQPLDDEDVDEPQFSKPVFTNDTMA